MWSPEGITKEEFGLELYEAIRLFGARAQVQEYYKLTCTKEGLSVAQRKAKLAELKKREQDLTVQIEAIMPKLKPEATRRLLQRFETPVSV